MKKLSIYFFIFNVAVIFLGSALYVYYTYLDGTIAPVVEVSEMSTTKNEYKRGELMQIDISFCRNRKTPISYHWKMYNHVVTEFAPKRLIIEEVGETGCYTQTSDVEMVPRSTELGPHYLELTVSYEVNAFRSVEYKFKTNEFNVIK